jgi:hypothetical protein
MTHKNHFVDQKNPVGSLGTLFQTEKSINLSESDRTDVWPVRCFQTHRNAGTSTEPKTHEKPLNLFQNNPRVRSSKDSVVTREQSIVQFGAATEISLSAVRRFEEMNQNKGEEEI